MSNPLHRIARNCFVVAAICCVGACGSKEAGTGDTLEGGRAITLRDFEKIGMFELPAPKQAADISYMVIDGMVRVAERSDVGGPKQSEDGLVLGELVGRLCALFGPPDARADGFLYFVRHPRSRQVFAVFANSRWGMGYHAAPTEVVLVDGRQTPSPSLRSVLVEFESLIRSVAPMDCAVTFDSDEFGSGQIGYHAGSAFSRELPISDVLSHRLTFAQRVRLDVDRQSPDDAEERIELWASPFLAWDASRSDAERGEIEAAVRKYWRTRFDETIAYAARVGHDDVLVGIMACALMSVSRLEQLAESSDRNRIATLVKDCDE